MINSRTNHRLGPLPGKVARGAERVASRLQCKGYSPAVAEEVQQAMILGRNPNTKLFLYVGRNAGGCFREILWLSNGARLNVDEPSRLNVKRLNERSHNVPDVKIFGFVFSDRDGIKSLYSDLDGSALSSLVEGRLFGILSILWRTSRLRTLRVIGAMS